MNNDEKSRFGPLKIMRIINSEKQKWCQIETRINKNYSTLILDEMNFGKINLMKNRIKGVFMLPKSKVIPLPL